jgi:hypothetical protein
VGYRSGPLWSRTKKQGRIACPVLALPTNVADGAEALRLKVQIALNRQAQLAAHALQSQPF